MIGWAEQLGLSDVLKLAQKLKADCERRKSEFKLVRNVFAFNLDQR